MHFRFLLFAAGCVALPGGAARADERTPTFCELTPCLKGPIDRRALARDEPLGRVVCKAGMEAGFDAQGRIAFCTTAKAAWIDYVPVAADAYTLFHPNGRIYQTHLSKNWDYTIRHRQLLPCQKGLVAFHEDGRLRYCRLWAPYGTFRSPVGTGIELHPDGRVAGATIGRRVGARGTTFLPGTRLAWDASGYVVGGSLQEPMRVGGLLIQSDFEWYPGGKLKSVELAEATRVQGHDFPVRAKLKFRPDGSLEAARYVEKQGFMIHGEEWRDTATVTFDRSGVETSRNVEHWMGKMREPPPR